MCGLLRRGGSVGRPLTRSLSITSLAAAATVEGTSTERSHIAISSRARSTSTQFVTSPPSIWDARSGPAANGPVARLRARFATYHLTPKPFTQGPSPC
jgi:hypothetical protein